MRVISGILKGREILGYNINGTRPTMDRVKESIFSMIQNKLVHSVVLDLFAGSGNYGIECISQNAKFVYFNDKNKECIKVIKKNLVKFQILDKARILNMDYLMCLKFLMKEGIKFDLVFLDPPYKEHILESILKFLVENNLLVNGALIITEFMEEQLKNEYGNLKMIKTRTYGEKKVFIYEYIS